MESDGDGTELTLPTIRNNGPGQRDTHQAAVRPATSSLPCHALIVWTTHCQTLQFAPAPSSTLDRSSVTSVYTDDYGKNAVDIYPPVEKVRAKFNFYSSLKAAAELRLEFFGCGAGSAGDCICQGVKASIPRCHRLKNL